MSPDSSVHTAGKVKIWEAGTGACLRTLEGPDEGITWLQWHPRGSVVIAGSEDFTSWMWNADSGDCMQVPAVCRRPRPRAALPSACLAVFRLVCVLGTSAALRSGAFPETLHQDIVSLVDRSGSSARPAVLHCVQVFTGHSGAVACGSFTPDGKLLVTGGSTGDASLRVWNPRTGECTHTIQGHQFHQAGDKLHLSKQFTHSPGAGGRRTPQLCSMSPSDGR